MAYQAKSDLQPGGDEQVGFIPAVEADAECIGLQHPIHRGEGGFESLVIVVVGDRPAGSVAIARDVDGSDAVRNRQHSGADGLQQRRLYQVAEGHV
jgi:hypothetical protein